MAEKRNFLKEWQSLHGLDPDGKVGKDTTKALMEFYKITNMKHFIGWISQVQHESQGFTKHRENMNYSWQGVMATFNTSKIIRFDKATALKYGRTDGHPANQEMIGNIAYANRGGNGNIASGDGFKFRGGGGLHTTFRGNYEKYFAFAGLPINSDPEILGEPDHFFKSAVFWFNDNKAWKYAEDCSEQGIKMLSNLVNAGDATRKADPFGLPERIHLTQSGWAKNGLA